MRHTGRVRTFGGVPICGVPEGAQANDFVATDGRCRLALQDTRRAKVALKPLAREERIKVIGLCASVRDRDPSIARNERDRVRASRCALVTDRHCGAALLENNYFL
jgi:hypothetical protein